MVGELRSDVGALDEEARVRVAGALKLERQVAMYQWHERAETVHQELYTESNVSATRFSYPREWSAQRIDSSRFRSPPAPPNPSVWPLASASYVANDARLGLLRVAPALLQQLQATEPVPVGDETLDALSRVVRSPAHRAGAYVFLGHEPTEPFVGDLRVAFRSAPACQATVLARLSADGVLEPHVLPSGLDATMLRFGNVPLRELAAELATQARPLVWVARVVCGAVLAACLFARPT